MWDGSFDAPWYDVAEVCMNGHVTNDSIKAFPNDCKKFCDLCGEATITRCVSCENDIQGYHHHTRVAYSYSPPAYCIHCGSPYPWIKSKIEAANDLADIIDDFTDQDKELLNRSLQDIVRDTPRGQVAALQFKRLLSKTEPHIVDGFRNILYSVLSDPINKQIW